MGWGSCLRQGCHLWSRDTTLCPWDASSTRHISRCSENIGMEGKEKGEVNHPKESNQLLFTKHKDGTLPNPVPVLFSAASSIPS